MKIIVGSKNPVKVNSVKELIGEYEFLKNAKIVSKEVLSQVSEQPKSLKETVQGAINRARNSFKDCDISIGIESGLMKVPHSKTGVMNVNVCAIYDGQDHHLGISSAFELPRALIILMKDNNLDLNSACYKFGLSPDPKLGSKEGAIGVLTKGRITRVDYTKQAIITAMIHLENKHLFLRKN